MLLANNVDPDLTPPYVASDLHCLPMALFLDFQIKNRLNCATSYFHTGPYTNIANINDDFHEWPLQ